MCNIVIKFRIQYNKLLFTYQTTQIFSTNIVWWAFFFIAMNFLSNQTHIWNLFHSRELQSQMCKTASICQIQITLFIELQASSSKLYSNITFFYQFVSLFMWNLFYSLKKMNREMNLFYSRDIWDLTYKCGFRQKWIGLFIEIARVLIEVIF